MQKVVKSLEVVKHAKPRGLRSCRRMRGSLLPFEIVATILSRLPVKSLLRFRCVCKEWRTLTYNPNFIEEHQACARALGRLALISTGYSSPKMLLYDFGDNRNGAFNMRFGDLNGYTISNPVNGLICCRESCNSNRYDEGNHCLLIPATREFAKLLMSRGGMRFGDLNGYTISNPVNGLICCRESWSSNRHDEGNHYLLNPATREFAKLPTSGGGMWDKLTSVGLGFDSSTGVYKLVKFFHVECDMDLFGCKVLELGTQEWREVGLAPCMIPNTVPVHLNGALHWISTPGNIDFAELTIVAFNLKDEKFRLIPVPPECSSDQVYLVEWEGLLCLVKLRNRYHPSRSGCASKMDHTRSVMIWRLEDYATCRWSEAHCSKMSNYASRDGRLDVVGIRGHEILLALMPGQGLGSLCSYDLCTRNLNELYHECPSGLQFLTESLVSPRYLAGNLSLH